MKIFIFEDEYLIATSLMQHLKGMGYQDVSTANNLEKAYRIIDENFPDIAILDIRIPEDNEAGIKVAKRLNNKGLLPIIFMTSNDDDEIIEKALGTKPNAYLSKSFNQKIILRTIEVAIQSLASQKMAGIEKTESESSFFFNTEDYILLRKKKDIFHKVKLEDILYIFSESGVIKIITSKSAFSFSSTLAAFMRQVDDNRFIKVSRNYVVNMHHFETFLGGNYIQVADKKIQLSQSEYKKLFGLFKVLKSKKN